MLFNSFEFLLFFIIVTAVYFILPHRYRWFHLLAASCYFYMFFVPVYIFILAGTIVVDYFAGIWIEDATGRNRKLFLIFSLIANIGVLAIFKYYNFFIENINQAIQASGNTAALPYLKILLPIGLSFHTFQAMSYTIEVYRRNQKAEKHFGIYALYVMFYPQLVAGPIERPQNMLHQFHKEHKFNADDLFIGFKLILWGMFKKVVIADRIAILVNQVYDSPQEYNATMLFIASVFFAIQIYCDFSGYSAIALGTAKVMGFNMMQNFNNPYQAKTISEFWKRWHISLSTWFKDYLYISLGGNRVTTGRLYINLFIVFIVSGFWHGANWTFIVWGALHGFYLVWAMLFEKPKLYFAKITGLSRLPALYNLLQVITTFLLVTLAWVFFRANTVRDAMYIIKKIFTGHWGSLQIEEVFSKFSLILSTALIALLFWAEMKFADRLIATPLGKKPKANLAFGIVIISMILLLGVFQKLSFIYFQF
jgi:alginate O-acetyltransferase complex protein AlgI